MNVPMDLCPIWGTRALVEAGSGDWYTVESLRAAGRYSVSGSALLLLSGLSEREKANLTFSLIEQRYKGSEVPRILIKDVNEVRRIKSVSVLERADWLLKFLEKSTQFFGQKLCLTISSEFPGHIAGAIPFFYILAWTSSINADEVRALIEYCHERGFIKILHSGSHYLTGEIENYTITLTIDGFRSVQNLNATSVSTQAFVAMWFNDEMLITYTEGIKPAIENCGYQPLRIDQIEHNDKVDDAIISNIRQPRFMVADLTHGPDGARANVYYEAGFAHGMNIPVIFTCKEDPLVKIHFDIRQYNCIEWKNSQDLKKRLQERIGAIIGLNY